MQPTLNTIEGNQRTSTTSNPQPRSCCSITHALPLFTSTRERAPVRASSCLSPCAPSAPSVTTAAQLKEIVPRRRFRCRRPRVTHHSSRPGHKFMGPFCADLLHGTT